MCGPAHYRWSTGSYSALASQVRHRFPHVLFNSVFRLTPEKASNLHIPGQLPIVRGNSHTLTDGQHCGKRSNAMVSPSGWSSQTAEYVMRNHGITIEFCLWPRHIDCLPWIPIRVTDSAEPRRIAILPGSHLHLAKSLQFYCHTISGRLCSMSVIHS